MRATAMGSRSELNIGQLARQHYGDEAFRIGFSTYDCHVSAASNWGGPVERKRVRPARVDSHEVSAPQYWLATSDLARDEHPSALRLERAIGIIYRPRSSCGVAPLVLTSDAASNVNGAVVPVDNG